MMTVIDALKSAQFVVDNRGRQTAVLLDIQSWQALLDWIEDVADIKIATQSVAELEAAGGRPQQAGWLDWDKIGEEL
ncbi:MAG: hypothetical protein D6796_13395 [Caldilineae bacterium]|nr:MAG: hypothetical protein D6796_13395 [Caldilineae bacterium]